MKRWILIALVGCGTSAPAPDDAPVPAAAPAQAEAPAEMLRAAVVREVIHAERYTYARMDACGQEAWVAGPNMALEVGQTLLMQGGATMTDFHSKALDRTFDAILFVDGWKRGETELKCAPKIAPRPRPVAPAGASADVRTGIVVETMDSSGYTYALLDVCGTKEWVAGPAAPVAVGQVVATPKGSAMPGFTSKSLGRTFDSIFFVQKFLPPAGPPDCG